MIPAEGEFSTKIDPPPTKDLVLQTSEENIAPVLRKALQQQEQALGSCRQLCVKNWPEKPQTNFKLHRIFWLQTLKQSWQRTFQMDQKCIHSCMKQSVSCSICIKQPQSHLQWTECNRNYITSVVKRAESTWKVKSINSKTFKYLKCRYQEGGWRNTTGFCA